MFDFFWEFVGWDLSVFQRYFPTQYWTIQLCCRSIVHHVFDYWHLLDCNCSIAKRLWWNKLWGNTTSARPLVLCSVCSNFEFPRFSTVWMGHIFFSCLESDTKILPPRFLPTKSFFLLMDRPNRYMCIPLPTSTLRFLVSDRLYRSILPTTHFTSLLPTLFFSSRGVFAANIVCAVRMSKTIALTSKSILVTWAPRWAPKRFSTCVLLPNEFSEYFRFVSFCEVTNK